MSSTAAAKHYVRELAKRALQPAAGAPVEGRPAASAVDGIDVAAAHVTPGTAVAASRMRGLKLAVLRLARLWTHDQEQYNVAVLDALRDLERRAQGAPPQDAFVIAALESAVDEQRARLAALEAAVARADARVAGVSRQHLELETSLRSLHTRVNTVLSEARRALPDGFDQLQLRRLSDDLDADFEQLYQDFEDAFRGTRDHVRALVTSYLPDVARLPGPLLDMGSGRGEWLEVLAENGIDAYGVDTNEKFAKESAERGVKVIVGDALAHLTSLDDGSLGAVTAFHLVEHLPLDVVVTIVDHALRVLRPGGLLLFETPNPTNLVVGAAGFYLDPTHIKPIHPTFLAFLVESRGFVDVETRFLHPVDGPRVEGGEAAGPALSHLVDTVNWAFFGPQDYAVLARRVAPA